MRLERPGFGSATVPALARRPDPLEATPMRRRARLLAILAVPMLVLSVVGSAAGASVIEDYARVIRSRHASAAFLLVDGCRQVEVFVSAMDGTFGARGGRINKQGLLGVFYAERDVCGVPGPKGFPVTYAADAMTLDRLGSTPRFDRAWVRASLTGLDSDGNEVVIGLDLAWSPIGPYERSRVSGNGWFPANGQRGAHVHTFSHGLRVDATASGSLTLNGTSMALAPTSDASLEQVRYFCQVIQHPHGGFDVDC
jgi:hypothetical protein